MIAIPTIFCVVLLIVTCVCIRNGYVKEREIEIFKGKARSERAATKFFFDAHQRSLKEIERLKKINANFDRHLTTVTDYWSKSSKLAAASREELSHLADEYYGLALAYSDDSESFDRLSLEFMKMAQKNTALERAVNDLKKNNESLAIRFSAVNGCCDSLKAKLNSIREATK